MRDAAEYQLMNAWQRGFPLVARPFAEIGLQSGRSELEVLEQFRKLRAQGLIDRIGPVFRPNTVGASTLAAMAVPSERLAAVAELVSRQPGVNHNYEREHSFNLWFVATGPAVAALQATLSRIASATGLRVLNLPLLEEFHIDLGFDLDTHDVPRLGRPSAVPVTLTPGQKQLVSKVSGGLPLVPRPYAELGVPESDAIGTLRGWVENGVIRRLGAVVRHRRLGYLANAMLVWELPDEAAVEAGRRLAADRAVTLCYRRARALPDWRYNLYCMVHGRERSHVGSEVERLCAAHGLDSRPRAVLFSKRCFSQRAARYG
jgi:DNA-binding Lrp family transcriptional regulator